MSDLTEWENRTLVWNGEGFDLVVLPPVDPEDAVPPADSEPTEYPDPSPIWEAGVP